MHSFSTMELNLPEKQESSCLLKRYELTNNSSGNTRPQSSQLAEPLWIDPCLKSGISVCNNKKSTGGERMDEHSPPNSCKQEKIHHQKNAQTWLAYTEMHMQQSLLTSHLMHDLFTHSAIVRSTHQVPVWNFFHLKHLQHQAGMQYSKKILKQAFDNTYK